MTLIDAIQFVQSAGPNEIALLTQEIKRRTMSVASRLHTGQQVIWRDKDGTDYTATVQSVNQKTISLKGGNHPRYTRGVRVPKEWVRPA